MDRLLDDGWVDTFRELYPSQRKYSWWSYRRNARASNLGWRLDYFVVNDTAMKAVGDSMINNEQVGSDHCPVEMRLNVDLLD